MTTPEITVQELKQLQDQKADFMILDVRRQNEYDFCNLGGHLLPFEQLTERVNELDPNKKIIIHCHGGGRSKRATDFLMSKGFTNVFNLKGGITAWANEIDPTMKKY